MIRICAYTNEAEKAISLFESLKNIGFIEYAEPYNALIFALSSHSNFARRAIDFYRTMLKRKVVPDRHTFVAVLKATAHIGDINTACEVLETMKTLNVEMTEHTYNGLIRTYAGACIHPDVKEDHIAMYIKDAWELLAQMKEKDIPITNRILNNMVLLHCNALYTQELHEKVLPMFEKLQILPNIHTYQQLMRHYTNISEIGAAMEIYDKMKELSIVPNAGVMDNYLQIAVMSKNNDYIIDALTQYIDRDMLPRQKYIKSLSRTKDMPDRLYVALQKFPIKFGDVRKEFRTFTPPTLGPRLKMKTIKRKPYNKRVKVR